MLGVGNDWAGRFHLVALGRGEDGVFEVTRVEHTPTAVTAPMSRTVGLAPESLPQRGRVNVERPRVPGPRQRTGAEDERQ
jgi:hypothetical protein